MGYAFGPGVAVGIAQDYLSMLRLPWRKKILGLISVGTCHNTQKISLQMRF